MATVEFNTRIKNKRDTNENWSNNNPILLNGEVIIVDMSNNEIRLKVGNGIDNYNSLPFIVSLPVVTEEDNGKLLQVVNGTWSTVSILNADEIAY